MLTFENKRNDILAALGGTPYSLTDEGARITALKGKVRGFSRIRGNALSEEEVADTAQTLDNALMRYYDSLPLKEIELALEWEMVTGESIRLTVHNMLKGVAKYLNSEERRAAFTIARKDMHRDAEDGPTPQEVNLLNFDAMRDEVSKAWEGYLLGGRLEPYRIAKGEAAKDGWRGDAEVALRISQRQILAGCYAWLKTHGVVPDCDETRRREGVCLKNARKEGAAAVSAYAEALMLEWTFKEAADTGRDLRSEIRTAAGRTTEIVRMNTPLRRLKTI